MRCSPRDLVLDYYGGGAGTGHDFGLIRLRDTAPVPCVFAGPVGLVGQDASGAPDTDHITYRVAHTLTLTPRTRRTEPGHEVSSGSTVATIAISAEYRDDPTSSNGLCSLRRVVPKQWQVTLPTGTISVANASSGDPYREFSSLITCAGELDTPSRIVSS